jgi:chromosomal replication initiation ATPase DnaA
MIIEFSQRTGISTENILGRSRRVEIVAARQLYWLLLFDKAGFSPSEIANLNDVNHASVIHGVRMAREKLEVGDRLICDLWELVKDIEV